MSRSGINAANDSPSLVVEVSPKWIMLVHGITEYKMMRQANLHNDLETLAFLS